MDPIIPTEFPKEEVVEKLWGKELWQVNNELYCCKVLIVEPLFACSLHRHLVKDETFLVRQGTIFLEYGNEQRYLGVGDWQRIKPKTWHRFSNRNAATPAIILEVSTTHSDADVERFEPSAKISGPLSSEPSPPS